MNKAISLESGSVPPDATADKTPVSAQVARHLLDLVARERLMPGDGVPSEIQLTKDLGVSRGSVREAYRTLAALGILSIENGRRPRLQSIRAEGLAQVFGYALTIAQVHQMHVIDTRRGIEVHGAQLAAQYVTPVQKSRLQGLVDEMRESLVDRRVTGLRERPLQGHGGGCERKRERAGGHGRHGGRRGAVPADGVRVRGRRAEPVLAVDRDHVRPAPCRVGDARGPRRGRTPAAHAGARADDERPVHPNVGRAR